MRPVATQVIAHIGQVEDEIEMSIAKDAMAHIMTVLTDLYSDQALAVIREYSTNALDSNIEAGNPEPIHVTLPTHTNPSFVVQDHGVGLNVDDLRRIYANYGASTKRESDLVTGMLGLGCKSALTYALSFTVEAVKSGIKTIAMVTKNEQGIGAIKILDTAGTAEPNGVKITVPVKAHEIASFVGKAMDFYSYWTPGTVLVDGEEPDFLRNLDDADAMWIDEDVLVRKSKGKCVVVMGNVPYPFAWPEWHYSLVAWVPMGSVAFTPSRESLMTNALTEETLKALRLYVLERFEPTLRKRMEDAATPWEQLKLFHSWRWRVNGLSARGRDSLSSIPLRGRTAWNFNRFGNNGNGTATKYQDYVYYQEMLDESTPVVTDFPHRGMIASARHRLRQLASKKGASVVVLPDSVETSQLAGRPNTFTWDQVVATTEDPPKAASGKKGDTVYTFWQDGKLDTFAGQYDEDPSVPLLYATVADVPVTVNNDRWYRPAPQTCRTVVEYSKRYPEAMWVSIGEHQVAKFQRLHPWAKRWSIYVQEVQAKALAALTETDKQSQHLSGLPHKLATDLARMTRPVSDPELRTLHKLAGHKSAAIDRCKELHLQIPAPKHPLINVIDERYPLLAAIYNTYTSSVPARALDDLYLYLEARWALAEDDN